MKNKERKKSLIRRLSSYDDIKNNFLLKKNLLKREKKEVKKDNIKETFSDALLRLGIKPENEEEHLNKVYKSLKVTSIISFIMFVILTSVISYQIFIGNGGVIIYAFYFIALTIFLKSFESAFRCFQIRKRELLNIKEYIKAPKEWYPKSFIYKKEEVNGKQ